MRSYDSFSRHPASDALIRLRGALAKTQQAFAVEDMRTAVTTVGRWETTHPPRGDVLLRLAEIADKAGEAALRDVFRRLYVDDIFARLNFRWSLHPATESEPATMYQMEKLVGRDEIQAGMSFATLIGWARGKDAKLKAKATAELAGLSRAVRALQRDEIAHLENAFIAHAQKGAKK